MDGRRFQSVCRKNMGVTGLPHEKVLVLDFGGQYNQLIARRVRENRVYSELLPYTTPLEQIERAGYKGIILTGGPANVMAKGAPTVDRGLFRLGVPILGICYGAQLMAHLLDGVTGETEVGEYGSTTLSVSTDSALFTGVTPNTSCFMSHAYVIKHLPSGFRITAKSPDCPVAAMENAITRMYAVQFHPEVNHTPEGGRMLRNFLFEVCGCKGDWDMGDLVRETCTALRGQIGESRVLCALSGGVDSAVAATLLYRAIGDQLVCIFVDHGLLRLNEGDEVEQVFRGIFGAGFHRIDASERFLAKLAGVTEPERKRAIIGEEFIRVFEEEAGRLGELDYLVQGTIYSDVIESGLGDAAVIKSHHNVGGLPSNIQFKGIIEPLRSLFKDEVRALGLELGLPESLVRRQPFPGPGLAIRILGEVTREKLDIVARADAVFREEIAVAGYADRENQYFAVLTDSRTVGVMGDERTYAYVVALRAVNTKDIMTAEWMRLPYEVLEAASHRIVNGVRGVNRVVYDITSKPPATIEWE